MSDFNSIKVHELSAFVRALTLIDDLLTISLSKNLLSRKRGLFKALDGRLDLEVFKVN